MNYVLKTFGGACIALLAFVAMLHGALLATGKYTPETLGKFHDMPVVGGFFPKHEPTVPPPSPEEIRNARASEWLAAAAKDVELPAPYSSEEIGKLVRDLKDAREQHLAAARRFEEERTGLDKVGADLESQKRELLAGAGDLERKSRELLGLRDELERERAFIRRSEERNLKSLASIYEAMAPDEAAGRLALMDDDTAAKLVSRMSERKAGKVLGALETPRAVAVTRRMKSLTEADAPTSRPEAR